MNKIISDSDYSCMFITTPTLLVVIPARSGSKRFPNKNIAMYDGQPLLIRSAMAAKGMSCKPRVVVSTDSEEYASICDGYSVSSRIRPDYLACDSSPKLDTIIDTVQSLYREEGYLPRYVLSLQANSLGITTPLLDNVFKFHQDNNCVVLKETISVDSNGCQNGAIRLLNIASLFQPSLSTYLYTYTVDLVDIHTPEDLLL